MAQELDFIVVEANTVAELEKKVNDRMAFGYDVTETPIVIHTTNKGTTYYQTMIKD
jgi:hypothetical protein